MVECVKGMLMSLATKGLTDYPFWEGALSRSSRAIISHNFTIHCKITGNVYRVVHDMCQSFDTFIQVEIICLCDFYHVSQCMKFPAVWYVRPAKPQISLRIRAV